MPGVEEFHHAFRT